MKKIIFILFIIFLLCASYALCLSFFDRESQMVKKIYSEYFSYKMSRTASEEERSKIRFFDQKTGDLVVVTKKRLEDITDKVNITLIGYDPNHWIKNYSPMIVFNHKKPSLSHFNSEGQLVREKILGENYGANPQVLGFSNNEITLAYFEDGKLEKHYIETISVKDMKSKRYKFDTDKLIQPYRGVFLKKRNQLAFSTLSKGDLYLYDFKTKKIKSLISDSFSIIYHNEINDIKSDENNNYVFLGIERATRGPSKWIGFYIYDLDKEKIVFKEKFGERSIFSANHWIGNPRIFMLDNNEVGFTYLDMTAQHDHFIKYRIQK